MQSLGSRRVTVITRRPAVVYYHTGGQRPYNSYHSTGAERLQGQ